MVNGRIIDNEWVEWYRTLLAQAGAVGCFNTGLSCCHREFLQSLVAASQLFAAVESQRVFQRDPFASWSAYCGLLAMNAGIASRYTLGAMQSLGQYMFREAERSTGALEESLLRGEGQPIRDVIFRREQVLRWAVIEYPKAIQAIEQEYGFHFERDPDSLVAETDRFELRRVKPDEAAVETDEAAKPILIIPPFVLGANILSFLPKEGRSYAHAFANQSVPTYIRILKAIEANPAVQTMSAEDDAEDTGYFCEVLRERHDRPVTLNGYCQGGYSSLCNILSGRLDGLVDALITCVAPMDGTRSRGLGGFLRSLPPAFNDLAYGTRTLANGNKVASGELMGWVYKLKSIGENGPVSSFMNTLGILDEKESGQLEVGKTAAALHYWLQRERSDLPLSVTEMSYRSYTVPIKSDGTLPVVMFGRTLNLHALGRKNISWLICYGEDDDLVEKEVALAPLDFIDAEVTPFPKGHVAIATSWSRPGSACSLDSVFGVGKYRGPVRFHLDLEKPCRGR